MVRVMNAPIDGTNSREAIIDLCGGGPVWHVAYVPLHHDLRGVHMKTSI